MINRRYNVIVFVLVAVVVALIAKWARPTAPDPVYQGKTLSDWLADEGGMGLQTRDAVRAIGTNGIPKLLEMISAKDPPAIVMRAADRIGFLRKGYYFGADDANRSGLNGFRILGTNAAGATHALTEVIERNRSSQSVICATEALEEIGPAAQEAVPVITKNFAHPDANVRRVSTAAIMMIRGHPEIAVPALIHALSDTDANVRWNASAVLQVYGTNAEPAIPELLKMLNDPRRVSDAKMRANVEQTLRIAGFRNTNNVPNQSN